MCLVSNERRENALEDISLIKRVSFLLGRNVYTLAYNVNKFRFAYIILAVTALCFHVSLFHNDQFQFYFSSEPRVHNCYTLPN